MSAKPNKKSAAASPAPSATASAAGTAATIGSGSSDPRRGPWGKVIIAGVWVYVAALWLLALDQTFNWGIFGPTLPPMP